MVGRSSPSMPSSTTWSTSTGDLATRVWRRSCDRVAWSWSTAWPTTAVRRDLLRTRQPQELLLHVGTAAARRGGLSRRGGRHRRHALGRKADRGGLCERELHRLVVAGRVAGPLRRHGDRSRGRPLGSCRQAGSGHPAQGRRPARGHTGGDGRVRGRRLRRSGGPGRAVRSGRRRGPTGQARSVDHRRCPPGAHRSPGHAETGSDPGAGGSVSSPSGPGVACRPHVRDDPRACAGRRGRGVRGPRPGGRAGRVRRPGRRRARRRRRGLRPPRGRAARTRRGIRRCCW